MSLAAFALRLITVEALSGKTLAEDRVYDSAIEKIDALVLREAAPMIVVSVDDADSRTEPSLLGDESLTLLIETAVTGIVDVPVGEDSGGDTLTIATRATSRSLEATLDILWRQISRALLVGGPGIGPWQDLWHQFALRIVRVEKRRGGGSDKGVRFASRFVLITLTPLDDPPFGALPADGPWVALLAAMHGNDALAELGAVLAHAIMEPAGLPDWRVAQAVLGVSERGIRGIGPAPFAATETDEIGVGEVAAELGEITIDPGAVSTDDQS